VSVRVLVIPEDPFNNGYILKPLVDAIRNRVGQGRDLLTGMALKNLPHFYRLCPEVKVLRDRIDNHFAMDSSQRI
jgi:hypothetical protein